MVHGFEGCPGELAPLYTALQASLGSSCDLAVVDTLDPGMGDTPEENAAALDTYLTTHGLHGRPLFFIGHSLGGLIIRCYLARVISGPHPNVTVRGVVMLGTPNGGVQAWNLLPIHWMRAATFAERFNAVYPLPAGTRGRNLLEARPNDGVVSLHSAQQLTGEHVTLRTYPLDHWELLADGAVTEDVVRFIMEQGWTG